MMRWTIGLAVVFVILAILARVLQFGFSLALLAVAAVALIVAIVSGLAAKAGARGTGGPPDRTP